MHVETKLYNKEVFQVVVSDKIMEIIFMMFNQS